MKDTVLEKKFQEAVRAVEQKYAETHIGYFLSALKEAVQELQDSGMNISLEAHPRNERLKSDTWSLTASATLVADGLRFDWDLRGSQWLSSLAARLNGDEVAQFSAQSTGSGDWTKPDVINAAGLKEAIQNVIINALAEREVISRHELRGKEFAELNKPRARALKIPGGQP